MPPQGKNANPLNKTDKGIQAEIKNRVESLKCQLHTKRLDREKLHFEFAINREKRQLMKGIELVKKQNSGRCIAGMPPDGPDDDTHHKSSYFYGGSSISEKRLLKWRAKERDVQRANILFLEEYGRLPWDHEDPVAFGHSFRIVMSLMGYDPERIEDMLTTYHQGRAAQGDKVNQAAEEKPVEMNVMTNRTTADVFECLRKEDTDTKEDADTDTDKDTNRNRREMLKLKSKSLTEFSVRDWEKDLLKQYMNSLTVPRERTFRRIQSAPAPHLPKLSVSDPQTSGQDRSIQSARPTRTRKASVFSSPHFVTRKISGKAVIDTMISEDTHKENDDENESVDIKHDNTIINANQNLMVKSILNPNLISENSEPERHDSNQHEDRDSSGNVNQESANYLNETVKTPSESFQNWQHEVPSSLKPRSPSMLMTGSPERRLSMVAKPHNVSPKQRRTSVPAFGDKPRRRSTMGSRGGNDIQIKFTQTKVKLQPELQADISELTESVKAETELNNEDLVNSPAHDHAETPRLPQWKRDLLTEAPPGLSGVRGSQKVQVVMSKSQRRRELSQLVDDHVGDVRLIINQERTRRLSSRTSVFQTLRSVEHAMDPTLMSHLPEEEDPEGEGAIGSGIHPPDTDATHTGDATRRRKQSLAHDSGAARRISVVKDSGTAKPRRISVVKKEYGAA